MNAYEAKIKSNHYKSCIANHWLSKLMIRHIYSRIDRAVKLGNFYISLNVIDMPIIYQLAYYFNDDLFNQCLSSAYAHFIKLGYDVRDGVCGAGSPTKHVSWYDADITKIPVEDKKIIVVDMLKGNDKV